jgi:hypothetical protein
MRYFKEILLIVLSIILALIFLELILEVVKPQPKNSSWRVQDEETGTYLNIKNSNAKHQYYGKIDRVSVKYKFGKYHNRIFTDNQEIAEKKNILILGDSHIFGWLLKDKDTLVFKLQNKFNEYNFINASAGGWSDIDSFNYIKKFCHLIKPTKILFYLNIDRALSSNLLLLKDNKLLIKNVKINYLKKNLNSSITYKWLSENSNLFQLIKTIYLKTNNKNFINYNQKKLKDDKIEEKNYKQDLKLFLKLVEKIVDETEKCNSEIIFIDWGWDIKEANSKIKNIIFDELQKQSENDQIQFVSLYNEMNKVREDKKKFLLEEGHPNNLGNESMFKAISIKFNDIIK